MKKIRMGLESCEDIHDTTIRGDDYVDEPQDTNSNSAFDDLVTSVPPPSTAPVAAAPLGTQVSFYNGFFN